MDEAIKKADVLLEALGWILRFRGRHVVLKLGGSAMEDPQAVRSLLTDVVFMQAVGVLPIVVHWGGKDINSAMQQSGIEPRFVQGRRYTDGRTLDIVASVLTDTICTSLVTAIGEQGGRAVPLSFRGRNCLIAERLTLPDENGAPIDLGYVGEIVDMDRDLVLETCREGAIPVIPSLGVDRDGQLLNVNADTAAAAVARLLQAEKLVFLSDVPGIFLKRDEPGSLQSHLDAGRCRQLIASGSIQSGMIPKVDAALEALAAGVGKVHIVDGRMPHSVLLEIYSNQGIGTEIVP